MSLFSVNHVYKCIKYAIRPYKPMIVSLQWRIHAENEVKLMTVGNNQRRPTVCGGNGQQYYMSLLRLPMMMVVVKLQY